MKLLTSWWSRQVIAAAAPIVIAILSYEVALLFPGAVPVLVWKSVVSWLFLAAAAAVVVVAWRARAAWWLRLISAAILVPSLVLGWFMFSVRSNCAEGPVHIGEKLETEVASCK